MGIYSIINTSNPPPPAGQRWVHKDLSLVYDDIDFYAGRWIEPSQLKPPLIYILHKRNPNNDSGYGPFLPEFFNKTPPLVREDLLEVMIDEGVTNLQSFPAELHDPMNGEIHRNYRAVNLLGLVKAADLNKSQATVHDGVPLIDVSFDRLVVDETKTRGLLMFRLAENYTTILVHERLKQRILTSGFPYVQFYDLDEAAIL